MREVLGDWWGEGGRRGEGRRKGEREMGRKGRGVSLVAAVD